MWTLLSVTKKRSLRLWVLFFSLSLVLLLLQTLSGRLEGIVGIAWLWFFLCLGPGMILMTVVVLLDRQTNLLVTRTAHRICFGFTLGYLLLVFGTSLAEGWAITGSLSIQDYRRQSLGWLLPAEAILLGMYGLLFWKKQQQIFQKMTISTLAKQEANEWGTAHQAVRKESLQLIAEAKIEKAFDRLRQQAEDTGIGDIQTLTLLQAQWKDNEEKTRLGLLTENEAQRNRNRITLALMELIKAF